MTVSYDDVLDAAQRLRGVANETPICTSRTLDSLNGTRNFLKCESFQRGGAFKFRGAYNALSRLTAEQRAAGVLTFSSGNHAQALALAGSILCAPVVVVMPRDAPPIKVRATQGYGAEVVLYDRNEANRETLGRELAAERGLTIVPPYDHPHIIAGQGTTAKELFEAVGPLDALYVPCGGGGLLAGSALAAQALSPGCRVIGVEPALADDAARSFRSGKIETVTDPDTVADGARTPSVGVTNFQVIQALVSDIVTVEDDDLLRATHWVWERMKLVVEPTGALALAAAMASDLKGQQTGIVVSGGNCDFTALSAHWSRLGL